MNLPYADEVWNRALDVDGSDDLEIGDRHLRALLHVDAAVMSGGVGFAADVVRTEAFAAAVHASHYFGLEQLAELLRLIASCTPEDDEDLQDQYDAIDRENLIELAFRKRLTHSPHDFRPL